MSNAEDLNQLNEKLKNYADTIRKLHAIKNKLSEDVVATKEQLAKKEEECKNYIENIKSLEKKTDEVYKNVTSGNLLEYNEIKKQFDKEKMLLNELIKTYRNELDEKADTINEKQEEISTLKSSLEEERKNVQNLNNILHAKYDVKSQEIQFFKISTENSHLKSKLINLEEKHERLSDQFQTLKNEKGEIEKLFKLSIDTLKTELNIKNSSYNTLLKDYQSTCQTLNRITEELEKARYFNSKYEKESLAIDKKLRELDNQTIELRSENQGLQVRIKGNEIELEANRQKIKENEAKIEEFKLSKQVFDVNYIYLKVYMKAQITFQKEENNFFIHISNRMATRKFTFMDLDIVVDQQENTKIIVKFVRDNTQEEYFSNETQKLLQSYDDYRKRAIEVTDFSTKKTEKTNTEKKKKNVEKELNNIFDI
jgi:hypothetical protein